MATLDRVEAFFASSNRVQVVSPPAGVKPVDYAKQYANQKMIDRVKSFFDKPDSVRIVAPASTAGRTNHAQRFAETMGARFESALQKATGLEKTANAPQATNPYAAGRAARAAAPALKPEATTTLVKRKGRSL